MEAEAKEIDAKKRKIEIPSAKKIRRELNIIANISGRIYSIRGRVNGQEVAENSKPDIISILRKTYNVTERAFNRDLRDKFLGKKQAEVIITPEQNIEIQEEVDIENMMFINNQSEEQAEIITETTGSEIDRVALATSTLIASEILKNRQKVSDLTLQISELDFAIDNSIGNVDVLIAKKKELKKELTKVTKELTKLTTNTNSVIGKGITKKLKELNVARSQLIAEQEVGIAESEFRDNEAQALNASTVVTIIGVSITGRMKKRWQNFGDGRVRPTHITADGQTVNLDELFVVGGSLLRFPRDPLAPAKETIRCRCTAIYTTS